MTHLKTAMDVAAQSREWEGADQFAGYLANTLIPDLRESGHELTARDFETALKLIDAARNGPAGDLQTYEITLRGNDCYEVTWDIDAPDIATAIAKAHYAASRLTIEQVIVVQAKAKNPR